MKFKFLLAPILVVSTFSFAQVLPANRAVNWHLAGYHGAIPDYTTVVNITNYGGAGDSTTVNDTAFTNAVNSLSGSNGVIYFPPGTYLFHSTMNLRSGLIVRGAASDSTRLKFDLGGGSPINAINISGTETSTTTAITHNVAKDSSSIYVNDASGFSAGDYVRVTFNDSSLLFSTWAYSTVGQVVKIASIAANKITFESPLRLAYDTLTTPRIIKLNMITGVGIERLKIHRVDATVSQTSNIVFYFAAQCWINCIESYLCNFAHIEINRATNITIKGSYFHDAHAYGGGGQGYGVLCQTTTGECLIENNVFNHLRHSMLLQSGANGNVYGYNYSINPYWTEPNLPANSAGDMVLHGNYPNSNLFEGNIGQNMIIDDSHGKNGPYNTYFRNRGELYGLFMNANPASDNQNLIGNEVTNNGSQLGFYIINGTGHLQYGNNVKGTIYAAGTTSLTDTSYYHSTIPDFLYPLTTWPSVGIPNTINTGTNAAKERYLHGNYTVCNAVTPVVTTGVKQNEKYDQQLSIFPNPTNGLFYIQDSKNKNATIHAYLYDCIGNKVAYFTIISSTQAIDLSSYSKGIYILKAETEKGNYTPVKLVLQ
jgi:hypothetical protein